MLQMFVWCESWKVGGERKKGREGRGMWVFMNELAARAKWEIGGREMCQSPSQYEAGRLEPRKGVASSNPQPPTKSPVHLLHPGVGSVQPEEVRKAKFSILRSI